MSLYEDVSLCLIRLAIKNVIVAQRIHNFQIRVWQSSDTADQYPVFTTSQAQHKSSQNCVTIWYINVYG